MTLVGIIMGSKSDWATMQRAADVLDALGVAYEAKVVSAHRTPQRLYDYATGAAARGLKVIIAGAGGAAHLPGMAAAMTTLPGLAAPGFTAGLVMSLSLIMAIGPQNAHVIRTGLQRQHLWLTVLTCALADIVLITLGVAGLAQLGGLSDKLHGALIGAGVLFLLVYGWQAARRFWQPPAAAPVEDGAAAPAQPAIA